MSTLSEFTSADQQQYIAATTITDAQATIIQESTPSCVGWFRAKIKTKDYNKNGPPTDGDYYVFCAFQAWFNHLLDIGDSDDIKAFVSPRVVFHNNPPPDCCAKECKRKIRDINNRGYILPPMYNSIYICDFCFSKHNMQKYIRKDTKSLKFAHDSIAVSRSLYEEKN